MVRSRFGLLDQVESIPLETKKRLRKKYNSDEQSDKKYVETTYSDLKELRDKGKLIPGALYRITDYQCTTIQEGTCSTGHQFDIIVQAISESVLSEDARAIQHKFEWPETGWSVDDSDYVLFDGDIIINNVVYAKYIIDDYAYLINKNAPRFAGNINDPNGYKYSFFYDYYWDDGWVDNSNNDDNSLAVWFEQDLREFSYFSNSNLAAWKLKYCLDNDESRFAWAKNLYLSPVSHNKCIQVYDANSYIYVRQPQLDSEQGLAWVYDADSDNLSIKDYSYNGENLELSDIIYTESEDIYIGQSLNLDGHAVIVTDFSEQGKGVIYQMIDEHNNNCPYDFKNIQFLRNRNWHNGHTEWCEAVLGEDPDRDIYYFTFSWVNDDYSIEDVSVVGKKDDINVLKHAENNIIDVYKDSTNKYSLNNIILVSSGYFDNGFYYGTINNVFRYGCRNCTFGNNTNNNVFDTVFMNNILCNDISRNKSFNDVYDLYVGQTIDNQIIYQIGNTQYFKDIQDAFSNT